MEKKTYTLRNARDRSAASYAIVTAPDGWTVTIAEPTRNSLQNAALHAMLSDIAHQVEWKGQKFTVEIWKRLVTAAWLRESGGNPLLVPSLDGNGVDIIFERTSKLSVKQCADLITWVEAFGIEQGCHFTTNREE